MIAGCQAPLWGCLHHPGWHCGYTAWPPVHSCNARPGISYRLRWTGRMKSIWNSVYICSCSVSYLYTHLNLGKVYLEDLWLGNLIQPLRANLTENSNRLRLDWEQPTDKGVWTDSPVLSLTDSWAFVMERPLPSLPASASFSLSIPFSPQPSLSPPPLLPFPPTPLIYYLTKPFTLAVPILISLSFVFLSFWSWSDYTAGWTSLLLNFNNDLFWVVFN